jgi:hypothetical protein
MIEGSVSRDWTGRVVGVLVGSLLSLLVLMATMGSTYPSRGAVEKMIANESPYVKDQRLILLPL